MLYPNGADFVVAALAAARIGAVVVPYSTFQTAAELRTQLLDSDTAIMLSAPGYRQRDFRALLTEAGPTPCLRHVLFEAPVDTVDAQTLAAAEADVDACDPLAIIYTSGSTGPPKGAVHTHGSSWDFSALSMRSPDRPDGCVCSATRVLWRRVSPCPAGCIAAARRGAPQRHRRRETLDLLEEVRPNITNEFVGGISPPDENPTRLAGSVRAAPRQPVSLLAPDVAGRSGSGHHMLG